MIDYGRSFFDNGNVNSKKIYDKICASRDCPDCGDETGFAWLDPASFLTISSQKKNESHDLRLIKKILSTFNNPILRQSRLPAERTFLELYGMVQKLLYGQGIANPREAEYGTTENLAVHANRSRITNVTNTYEYLKNSILKPEVIAENEAFYPDIDDKIGDFHIYDDGRDMEFIPV